jgi:hypothetical protein
VTGLNNNLQRWRLQLAAVDGSIIQPPPNTSGTHVSRNPYARANCQDHLPTDKEQTMDSMQSLNYNTLNTPNPQPLSSEITCSCGSTLVQRHVYVPPRLGSSGLHLYKTNAWDRQHHGSSPCTGLYNLHEWSRLEELSVILSYMRNKQSAGTRT